jgi:hypothetical protein
LSPPLLTSSLESVSIALHGIKPFWLSGLKEMSQSEASAAFAAAFFDSFFDGPLYELPTINQCHQQTQFILTSSLELHPIHGDLRLELGVLRPNRLCATEANVREQLIQQHHRPLLRRYLALAVGRNYRFADLCSRRFD